MQSVAVLHPCVRCAEASGAMRPACSRCPRCWRWLCAEHLPGSPGSGPAAWPGSGPDAWSATGPARWPDAFADRPSGVRPGAQAARGSLAGRACPACAVHVLGPLVPLSARLTTRMALISAVSVLGMLVGAVSVLLVAMAVGVGGELTVLCMLLAEMTGGALAGRHAERRVDAWLEARARSARARRLPRARLLPGRPGRRTRTAPHARAGAR